MFSPSGDHKTMFSMTVTKIIESTVALITQTVEIDFIQHGVR